MVAGPALLRRLLPVTQSSLIPPTLNIDPAHHSCPSRSQQHMQRTPSSLRPASPSDNSTHHHCVISNGHKDDSQVATCVLLLIEPIHMRLSIRTDHQCTSL